VRFLLLLALFFHAGPAEGTQTEDEMGTPNINTIIEWVRSEYPDLPRIQTTNCRPIAGSSTWSQHSWSNAADIFVNTTQGNELKPLLEQRFGKWIKVILWQVPGHFDHIHVDTWPTGRSTPPCAGGELWVTHKDGTVGRVFTDDIPKGGDELPLTQEDIDKIVAAVTPAVAQAVWFQKIHDAVTGIDRGAAFHLRMAREDSRTAAIRPLPGSATPQEIADAVVDEIAS
jgi:hypothetical protein